MRFLRHYFFWVTLGTNIGHAVVLALLTLALVSCADKKGSNNLPTCQSIADTWPNDNISVFPSEGPIDNPQCAIETLECEWEAIGNKHLNFYCGG